MKVLMVLQQSIYNNEGRWLTGDSNINMTVGILKEFIKKTDWEIDVLIAPLTDFGDIKTYDEIFSHPNVKFIPFRFYVNAFYNRQNFIVEDWLWILQKKYDVIINNITELSRNIKTLLFYEKLNTKLITQCFWLDTPNIVGQEKVDKSISYSWRQFDGFECSDLAVFTCRSTKKAFIDNWKKQFSKSLINKIIKKSVIWDFGFSIEELEKYKEHILIEPKTIVFLNRLSEINYTHHLEFIDAVNKLYKKRQDFQVIIANPSNKVRWEWLKEKVKPLNVIKESSLTREEYITLLWKSHISVHLFTKELYGGCANVESIYCGNISIMPEFGEYAYRGGKDYPFYVRKDFSNLVAVLNKALNSIDDNQKVYYRGEQTILKSSKFIWEMQKRNEASAFENISNKVIEDIKRIVK